MAAGASTSPLRRTCQRVVPLPASRANSRPSLVPISTMPSPAAVPPDSGALVRERHTTRARCRSKAVTSPLWPAAYTRSPATERPSPRRSLAAFLSSTEAAQTRLHAQRGCEQGELRRLVDGLVLRAGDDGQQQHGDRRSSVAGIAWIASQAPPPCPRSGLPLQRRQATSAARSAIFRSSSRGIGELAARGRGAVFGERRAACRPWRSRRRRALRGSGRRRRPGSTALRVASAASGLPCAICTRASRSAPTSARSWSLDCVG